MKQTLYLHLLIYWIIACCSPLQAQQLYPDSTTTQQKFGAPVKPSLKQPLDRGFDFSFRRDLTILAGGSAMVVAGYLLTESVPRLTEAEIAALDPNDINAFDRSATKNLRSLDANLSDYLLGVAAVSPFAVLASRSIRKESLVVVVMYFETAALNGGLTNITKGLFKRKRPYVYNPDTPMSEKVQTDARHSFFSGHVSHAAAFTYLTASLVNTYADRPGWKWAAWSGAVVIPGTIAYWRYTAGKHFPSDVLVGYAVGAGTGLLIPWLHRRELPKDMSLNVLPTTNGLYMSLTF